MHGPVEQHRFLGSMGDGVQWVRAETAPRYAGIVSAVSIRLGSFCPTASSPLEYRPKVRRRQGVLKKRVPVRLIWPEWPTSRRVR